MPLPNYINELKTVINTFAAQSFVTLRKNTLGPPNLNENDAQWIGHTATICDVTAYAVVAFAVGVSRVEGLKTAAAGAPNARTHLRSMQYTDAQARATRGGDLFYLFRSGNGGDANAFEAAVQAWMRASKAGAAQFKFNATDWHTFAVIRLPERGGFIVYQSYEGAYRLCDFLETATFCGADRVQYDIRAENNMRQHKAAMMAQVPLTAAAYGRHRVFTPREFQDEVVAKLKLGMGGGMLLTDYMLLSGHWAKTSQWDPQPRTQKLGSVFFLAFDGLQITSKMELTRSTLARDADLTVMAPIGAD